MAFAPMTAIADDVKPPWWQIPILRALKAVFPRAALIPNKVVEEAFRDPNEIERIKRLPLASPIDAIRLSTADECMNGKFVVPEYHFFAKI